jgi:hypothetical protein
MLPGQLRIVSLVRPQIRAILDALAFRGEIERHLA